MNGICQSLDLQLGKSSLGTRRQVICMRRLPHFFCSPIAYNTILVCRSGIMKRWKVKCKQVRFWCRRLLNVQITLRRSISCDILCGWLNMASTRESLTECIKNIHISGHTDASLINRAIRNYTSVRTVTWAKFHFSFTNQDHQRGKESRRNPSVMAQEMPEAIPDKPPRTTAERTKRSTIRRVPLAVWKVVSVAWAKASKLGKRKTG